LRQREEELAEAQVHLAKMERDFEASASRVAALESQLSQQSNTLAAQRTEIARLKAQLQQGGGAAAGAVARPAHHRHRRPAHAASDQALR
jgi:predicted  nucleic acid-binding Zn-ribbon protein